MEVTVREAVAADAREVRDIHLASIQGLGEQTYTEKRYGHGPMIVTQSSIPLALGKRIFVLLNTNNRSCVLAG